MSRVVRAFGRGEPIERRGDEGIDLVEGARSRRPQEGFQFGEREFDRIEVGTIRRQKAELRTDRFDRGANLWLLVDGEVIEHHHVPGAQRGNEHLLDVGKKRGIVDRSVEDRGRGQAVDPQGRNHRVGLPVPVGRVIAEPQAAETPTVTAQEVGRDARFVNEDVVARIAQREPVLPSPPRGRDIRTPLFVGVYRFF